MLNPDKSKPLKRNEVIVIFGIKIVNRYKIIELDKKSNIPKVIKFNGKVKTLNIGLKIINIKLKNKPPVTYVVIPPLTLTPVINI